jgi:curli biogenesis system outer membrane secretion channel CsgG
MRKFFIGLFMVILAAGSLAAEKTTVAFVGLEASGVSEASASGIADTLLDALINTKRFEIVERDRLNALMEEQGLALSGCTTTECFVQVGQLAGASKVVVGKVSKVGETYTVTVRVVDVFVGKVELSESSESSSLDGLLVASREMAARLAASIPVVGTVVSVSGETVKLDLGRQEGVNVGDKVELYRLGEGMRRSPRPPRTQPARAAVWSSRSADWRAWPSTTPTARRM